MTYSLFHNGATYRRLEGQSCSMWQKYTQVPVSIDGCSRSDAGRTVLESSKGLAQAVFSQTTTGLNVCGWKNVDDSDLISALDEHYLVSENAHQSLQRVFY